MFPRPAHSSYDANDRTARLIWGDDIGAPMPSGAYYCRGAVCWPKMGDDGNSVAGYAVVGGYSLDDKKLWVLSEHPFLCVENIFNDAGTKVAYPGIARWFSEVQTVYGCRCFYIRQETLTHQTYARQIARSDNIEPKPRFIDVEWKELDTPLSSLITLRETLKLMMAKHTDVNKAGDPICRIAEDEQLWLSAGGNPSQCPASLYALLVLVAGFDRYPYRKRREE